MQFAVPYKQVVMIDESCRAISETEAIVCALERSLTLIQIYFTFTLHEA